MSKSELLERPTFKLHQPTSLSLGAVPWHHGTEDCAQDNQPVLDVFHYDTGSTIVRQNKCLTFEAPFSYVLVGSEKVLLIDTGALSDESGFSFAETTKKIMKHSGFEDKEVIVIHSHSHRDHHQGDSGFLGLNNTQVIAPKLEQVIEFLGVKDWPHGQVTLDLGDRKVTLIPTPGHQEEAITIYDHNNKWLITGDTLYPGLIYVKDWQAYRQSINKLTEFVKQNEVKVILGGHIEMSQEPGKYYPIGSTYQPNETALPLSVQDLIALNAKLQQSEEAQKMVFNSFVVQPMSTLQKSISNIFRWASNAF
ncbi:MBL fold metallo-hydrolase [Pseudoalteromonas sp. SMS1]|uniref:MBL fold metallo-hydrolase n=1 Tax=Pseudoalteromonas sp. SMS1 TaxID=2908894 RepID=UPI001F42861C|nr:MBL fold metallo-hydrolase [Pseudoalteromonas sp. SMS1]MCF2859480.1 MBL fold metallo-hydrolase [Pseudoalteromonas sp. SMS1]